MNYKLIECILLSLLVLFPIALVIIDKILEIKKSKLEIKKTKDIVVKGVLAYCFECEIEMPIIKKKGFHYCKNCGLRH